MSEIIKCKFCGTIMKEFTESFVCCYNMECPHRKLPFELRQGGKTRGYTQECPK